MWVMIEKLAGGIIFVIVGLLLIEELEKFLTLDKSRMISK